MPRGVNQLEGLARDLRVAGSPRGLTNRLRRNIRAAVKPMQDDAKRNALAIPAVRNVGLRGEIANSIVTRTRLSGRSIYVRIQADKGRMPAGKQNLPYYMEGLARWRHPVFGNTDEWVPQDSHPYFTPAIDKHLPEVQAGVIAAVEETTRLLAR